MKKLAVVCFISVSIFIYGQNIDYIKFFSNKKFNAIELLEMQQNSFFFSNNKSFNWIMESGDYTEYIGTYSITKNNSQNFIKLNYKIDLGGYIVPEDNELEYFFCYNDGVLMFYNKENRINKIFSDKEIKKVGYEVKASTELTENLKGKKIIYSASNLNNEMIDEFWADGTKGDGVGEYFDIKFREYLYFDDAEPIDEPSEIDGVIILNGVFYSEKLYKDNIRLKSATIYFDKSNKTTIQLKDQREIQVINFDKKYITKNAKLTIDSVFKGDKWNDCCITKIIFFKK